MLESAKQQERVFFQRFVIVTGEVQLMDLEMGSILQIRRGVKEERVKHPKNLQFTFMYEKKTGRGTN